MRIKQIFAVRFIHSELDGKIPHDRVLNPLGLGVNLGDGTMYTTTRDGDTVEFSDNASLDAEDYVGHDRPLVGRPTESSAMNNGDLDGISDIVNHVYYHTRAYIPNRDDRLVGGITIHSGTEVVLKPHGPAVPGENSVTLEYQTLDGAASSVFKYTIPEGLSDIQPLRLRFRSVDGTGTFTTLPDDIEASYEPYRFVPSGDGLWAIELVHDYGEGPHDYALGDLVAYLRVGVVTSLQTLAKVNATDLEGQ